MRIVIDMQGAQSSVSRNRGIGRYTVSIVKGMARSCGEHEIMLALNGQFPDTIKPLRADFERFLPGENIRVWHIAAPVAALDRSNDWRRQAAELTYEAFLGSLKPDCIYITSLFEGFIDDSVTSIHSLLQDIPVATMLYDLIPYIHPQSYLDHSDAKRRWYQEKIEHLRHADVCLAISESSRQEGLRYLGLAEDWTVNVSTDADDCFRPMEIPAERERELRGKYGLAKPFILYTGGIDHRKNVEGLIRAYALLPADLRQSYQLAIVCSIQPQSKEALEHLAKRQGLDVRDIVFTGFVPDEELLAFYNLGALFVFPSWHEGFGLPVLEAMRCNAPVIGAKTSSIPEVIGWDEALFDPYSDTDIAAVMQRGLTDEVFRTELVNRAGEWAKKFSWDESGRRAIQAMERRVEHWRTNHGQRNIAEKKPRLAYVSPLPPERSGIADYSAELLPELAEFYEIDVVVAQDAVTDTSWVNENCSIRSVQWLIENSESYDRVLYHFGNSWFHTHMFDLLEAVPGVVVLHDFFLVDIVSYIERSGYQPGYWTNELYKAHGYAALRDRFQARDAEDIIWKYPCSLSVIQNSLGLIVHSPNSLRLATQWYGGNLDDWTVVPLIRDPHVRFDKAQARAVLGFESDDFLVCTFGFLGKPKLNHRLLDAWFQSSLSRDKDCHLVFVGENPQNDYGQMLRKRIHASQTRDNVCITGWVDMEIYHQYLAVADIGVQLRALSRGETSASVLDCMNYGKATIVNANGSMADLDGNAVWKLPDDFRDEQLVEALETLRQDAVRRQQMGDAARNIVLTRHDPTACAGQYQEAIEGFYQNAAVNVPVLARTIAQRAGEAADGQIGQLALAMAKNFVPRNSRRQLLVDISELVQEDSKSGIQRVVRSVLKEWLEHPPEGFRVEPVYATAERSYCYARRFIAKFMNCDDQWLHDVPIDYAPGDIFIGLDLSSEIVCAQRNFYQFLRNQGIRVKFLLYDVLPVQMPEYFPLEADIGFRRWLDVVTENDGAICISRAVADEVSTWLKEHAPDRLGAFEIDWFHLGGDIDQSVPTTGIPDDAERVLAQLHGNNSFLMVGTVEPRKGYLQVIQAVSQLWREGVDISLVIVGREGWQFFPDSTRRDIPRTIRVLRTHPELNKRLFWLEGISDEYLGRLYATSVCLLATSYGEGFGLPLIEAARHKLPVIARDIPVFREVAGEHAYFFHGAEPDDLAETIKEWLGLYKAGQHPRSDGISWLTWEESVKNLTRFLVR